MAKIARTNLRWSSNGGEIFKEAMIALWSLNVNWSSREKNKTNNRLSIDACVTFKRDGERLCEGRHVG